MKKISNQKFEGERPLFNQSDLVLDQIEIGAGESSLKRAVNVEVLNSYANGKYPLWMSKNVLVKNTTFGTDARASVWYTSDVTFEDSKIIGPKIFRDGSNVTVRRSELDALHSFWDVDGIVIEDVKLTGEYQFLHSKNIEVDRLTMDGNYSFQHTKNVVVRNSKLHAKDLFWNTEDVTVYDSEISGEYLGWYSKNLKLVNCKITGTQPLCYAENLVLENCEMIDCDLSFEESDVDATVVSEIMSVKNPQSGVIRSKGIVTLIDEFDTKVKFETI